MASEDVPFGDASVFQAPITYVREGANPLDVQECLGHSHLALINQRIAATKVQFDVDEPSMKKVKSKISELFSSLGRWENKNQPTIRA